MIINAVFVLDQVFVINNYKSFRFKDLVPMFHKALVISVVLNDSINLKTIVQIGEALEVY